MSNERAARRRRARIQQSEDGSTQIMHGGPAMLVEGDQFGKLYGRDMSTTTRPGEHLWVITAAWRVHPDSPDFKTTPAHLDLENMLTVAGPGCYVCEQEYTAAIAARPCPGDPTP